ncbi:MAG: hypothetical protein ACJ760_15340 [Thermoleophilaceae bacterium]
MRTPKAAVLVAALALAGLPATAHAARLNLALSGKSSAHNLDLFTITPDGTGRTKLTSGPAQDLLPAFSPARDLIVFTRVPASGPRRLFTVKPTGGAAHPIANTLKGSAPSWSPDATRIAFSTSDGGIYTIAPNGAGRAQLSHGPTDATPDWSPDSTQLVFARQGQIWRMNVDGTHLKKLNSDGIDPAWQPNGKHIAFVRKVARAGGKSYAVFAMNADGTHVKQVTLRGDGPKEDDRRPAWEPNSRHIAYAASAAGQSKIETILFGDPKAPSVFVTAGQTPGW